MNWIIDLIFILALLVGTIIGVVSGFILQLARICLLIIATYLTLLIHTPLANWLGQGMSNPFLVQIIVFVVIFALIYIGLFLIITWLIVRNVAKSHLKPLDQVCGGVLGFLKTALLCGTIVLVLIIYPVTYLQSPLKKSFLAPYLAIYSRNIVFLMPQKYKIKLRDFVNSSWKKAPPPSDRQLR